MYENETGIPWLPLCGKAIVATIQAYIDRHYNELLDRRILLIRLQHGERCRGIPHIPVISDKCFEENLSSVGEDGYHMAVLNFWPKQTWLWVYAFHRFVSCHSCVITHLNSKNNIINKSATMT